MGPGLREQRAIGASSADRQSGKQPDGVTRTAVRTRPIAQKHPSDAGVANLKSQVVTSSRVGLWKSPYAFTEQGLTMLARVLLS